MSELTGRPPTVWKQPNRPTFRGQVGDIWIDTDRDNRVLTCTDVVEGANGERNTTWRKLAPEIVMSPPAAGDLQIDFTGESPDRTCTISVVDADASVHPVVVIVF